MFAAPNRRMAITCGWDGMTTIVGILLSMAAAYAAAKFNNIMDVSSWCLLS